MRRFIVATLIGFALSFPAHAGHDHAVGDPLGAIGESFLRGLVHEGDVALAFGYLREALDAAVEGRDAPPADRLVRRGEEIGAEAKRRGAVAGHAVLDVLERSLRGIFRESLPPARPQQRL